MQQLLRLSFVGVILVASLAAQEAATNAPASTSPTTQHRVHAQTRNDALPLVVTDLPAPPAADGDSAAPSPAAQPALIEGVNVEALLAGMSVEHKVGQLMLIDFNGVRVNAELRRWVAQRRVGGLAFFRRNIRGRAQVKKLISGIRALDHGGIPPFFSLDQEGGTVVRIKSAESVLPSAMALGATGSADMARTAGKVVGHDLRSLGFTMNLAPVLDVNSTPRNPVIGVRSFGEDPQQVATIGQAFIEGLGQAGIVAVAKHFPGHGATRADSHYTMPSLPYDLQRLRQVELVPFERAMQSGLEALMTAHIALPAIAEQPDLPATLSYNLIEKTLRQQLGFDGIVITDGLEMRGIVDHYGLAPAAVRAVLAGADMLLVAWTSQRKEHVRQALLQAVARGQISSQRLDQSVRRILRAKARHHLLRGQQEPLLSVSDSERQINNRIAQRAATLTHNDDQVLPLDPLARQNVLIAAQAGRFAHKLKAELPNSTLPPIVMLRAPSRSRRRADSQRVIDQARQADLIVLGLTNGYYRRLVGRLKKAYPKKPVIVVSMGSPYLLARMPNANATLCLYSAQRSAQQAAVDTLVGRNLPSGKLPVSIPGLYPVGHGLAYPPAPDSHSGHSAGGAGDGFLRGVAGAGVHSFRAD